MNKYKGTHRKITFNLCVVCFASLSRHLLNGLSARAVENQSFLSIFFSPFLVSKILVMPVEAAPNGTRIRNLEYHKRLACDFGTVIFLRENRKIPQAGGLRYLEEILKLTVIRKSLMTTTDRMNIDKDLLCALRLN